MQKEIKVLDKGYVKYIAHLGDDNSPLEAARMSTDNLTGVDELKDDKLREFLWKSGHVSPFHFCELVLEVKLPIFVAREWMRHEHQFNEYSQRYSEALNDYYVPDSSRIKKQDKKNKQSSAEQFSSKEAEEIVRSFETEQIVHRGIYEEYLEDGLAREVARINMPVSNYTKFRVKTNLRNWLFFLKSRLDKAAQEEIREYAKAVFEICKKLWPKTIAVFEEHTLHAVSLSRTEKNQLLKMLRDFSMGDDPDYSLYDKWIEKLELS